MALDGTIVSDVLDVEKGASDLVKLYEKHREDVQRIAQDSRLVPEAREAELAKLREQVEPAIVATRDDLLARASTIGGALDSNERTLRQKARPEPKGEQWAEATARAPFVEQDMQNAFQRDPLAVVQAFHDALAEGDTVGAWLIYRAGERILKAGKAGRAVADLMTAALTAWPVDDKAMTAIKERRARMATVVGQLRQIRTAQETRDFASRFGVRQEYL